MWLHCCGVNFYGKNKCNSIADIFLIAFIWTTAGNFFYFIVSNFIAYDFIVVCLNNDSN